MDELIRQVRPGIQLPEKPDGDKEEPHDATAEAADATVNQPDDSQSDPSQETDTEEDAGPQ
jgi:hypothetical protein